MLLRVERAKVNSTLFIHKLPKSLTNKDLREKCENYGQVERVSILFDPNTFESKCCAFVKYTYKEDARDAQKQLQIENHRWVIDWAKSTKDFDKNDTDRMTLYIGGISRDATEEMIRERFLQYGSIEYLNYTKGEEKDGFAFIRFSEKIAAAKALESENNTKWLGRHIRVDYPDPPSVKEEKKKEKRNASTCSSCWNSIFTLSLALPSKHIFRFFRFFCFYNA